MDNTFNIILLRWYYSVLWSDNPGSVQSKMLMMPGKKAQRMEHLLCNHEDLYSNSQHHTKLDRVAYACNPSSSRVSWQVKTGEHLRAGRSDSLTYTADSNKGSPPETKGKVRNDIRGCPLIASHMQWYVSACTHIQTYTYTHHMYTSYIHAHKITYKRQRKESVFLVLVSFLFLQQNTWVKRNLEKALVHFSLQVTVYHLRGVKARTQART